MIKIDWYKLLKDHVWCGWVYFGSHCDGHPFAQHNQIYWQHYKGQGIIKDWKTKATKVKVKQTAQ